MARDFGWLLGNESGLQLRATKDMRASGLRANTLFEATKFVVNLLLSIDS